MKSVTDKLNVPTNVLDVATDLVRTKRGATAPGNANNMGSHYIYR